MRTRRGGEKLEEEQKFRLRNFPNFLAWALRKSIYTYNLPLLKEMKLDTSSGFISPPFYPIPSERKVSIAVD